MAPLRRVRLAGKRRHDPGLRTRRSNTSISLPRQADRMRDAALAVLDVEGDEL
jgi:hypothetical protein